MEKIGRREFFKNAFKTTLGLTVFSNSINSFGQFIPFALFNTQYKEPANTLLASSFDGLVTYLSGYMTEFQNASFYSYTLDGNDKYINDGTGDMYDSGNFTYPWFTSGTPNLSANRGSDTNLALSYDSSIKKSNLDFYSKGCGYGTAPDYRPLSMLAYRKYENRTIGFQKSGDSGSDGSGTLDSGFIYNGSVVNGFTVYAFRRQTFGTTDPSHCDLYMLIGHPNWGSNFGGTVQSYADPVSNGSCGAYLYATNATNVLAITSLLSKASGVQVSVAEIQTVVDAWISRIKTHTGF